MCCTHGRTPVNAQYLRRILSAVILSLFPSVAVSKWQAVERPELSSTPVSLRVAYAVNPRLPAWSDEQLNEVFDVARATAAKHFGVAVKFGPVTRVALETLFAGIPSAARAVAQKDIWRVSDGENGRLRMLQLTYETLRSQDDVESLIDFVRGYLPSTTPIEDLDSLSVALSKHHLHALQGGMPPPLATAHCC